MIPFANHRDEVYTKNSFESVARQARGSEEPAAMPSASVANGTGAGDRDAVFPIHRRDDAARRAVDWKADH